MCLGTPNKTTDYIRAYVRMRLHGCTHTCTLKLRAIGSLRMADYSATVIEGLKKFGFSEATVLFFKNQIGDGYYYRPQWRYSIASEKITIEFDVPTIRYLYTTRVY